MKNENKKIALIIGSLVLALVVYRGYKWYKRRTTPGQFDAFARCLSQKGVKMYGTDWCEYCQRQKKEFGKSFQYVSFVNCDYQKQECKERGVESYPTWIIGGKQYSGVQPLERLASLSGCELLGSSSGSGREEAVQETPQEAPVREATSEANEAQAEKAREKVREFEVKAFRFGYTPEKIVVNEGDKVKIIIDNTDTTHGIRIPELGVAGDDTVEFVATEAGEFSWSCNNYCGPGHGKMGGKLVVQ